LLIRIRCFFAAMISNRLLFDGWISSILIIYTALRKKSSFSAPKKEVRPSFFRRSGGKQGAEH